MTPTGRQLIEHGVIIGNIPEENIQQIGVDLNVIKIERIDTSIGCGKIPVSGKTITAHYVEMNSDVYDGETGLLMDKKEWGLTPGVYAVTFEQGCNVPENGYILIRQRSSLLRNGSMLHSSVFDPGYHAPNITSMLYVHEKIIIEYGARIAQVYLHSCNKVEEKDLYNGQWQGGK